MFLPVFSSDVFKFMIFFISFKTRLISARCFTAWMILLIAENIALLKEFNSIVDKLAAGMVTLELLSFLRWVYEIRDLSWNTRDLSFTWNWSVTVTYDALCLMYVCKSYDQS